MKFKPTLSALVRFAADELRLTLGGGFRHRGLTVQHGSILLDQRRCAEVVDRVCDALLARRLRVRAVEEALARIDVRVLPERAARVAQIDVEARWTGGFRDRGRVLLRLSSDWPERLGRALVALVLLELDPTASAADVAMSVTEEVDNADPT